MKESNERNVAFGTLSHEGAGSLDLMRMREGIIQRDGEILREVQSALQSNPSDPELLLMAALAALFAKRPDLSLRYEHRFSKRFVPMEAEGHLLRDPWLERWLRAYWSIKAASIT